ncbi:hypothetical protein BGY98DRAFT_937287 [Russula aff. rugulosa BPL654]|nr:hypothetical protein BGY98DRAFT_937287 [Russula aff. rugulosa BPL654]
MLGLYGMGVSGRKMPGRIRFSRIQCPAKKLPFSGDLDVAKNLVGGKVALVDETKTRAKHRRWIIQSWQSNGEKRYQSPSAPSLRVGGAAPGHAWNGLVFAIHSARNYRIVAEMGTPESPAMGGIEGAVLSREVGCLQRSSVSECRTGHWAGGADADFDEDVRSTGRLAAEDKDRAPFSMTGDPPRFRILVLIGVSSRAPFICTFQSQDDVQGAPLALCSLCGTAQRCDVASPHAFFSPIYRHRWQMLLKSLACKWVQSWERRHKSTLMEPHDSIRTEGRETLLGCQVMYEHIQVVTVAPQYGTVTVSAWRCQDNTLAPTHRTCPTFHGLSAHRTAVSEWANSSPPD